VLAYVIKESEKNSPADPIFSAPSGDFSSAVTKDAFEHLMEFDAGVIAEHIHLKATDLGLGSVVLYGFIWRAPRQERLCVEARPSGRGRTAPRGGGGSFAAGGGGKESRQKFCRRPGVKFPKSFDVWQFQ